MHPKVLLVDPHASDAHALFIELQRRHFDVRISTEREGALRAISQWGPDLVVLHDAPPHLDAAALCAKIRMTSFVPVMVLSATSDEDVALSAFEAGADDYVVGPPSLEQFVARARALLRRCGALGGGQTFAVGAFQIDFGERRVRSNGEPIRLTPKEFELFAFMARNPSRVLTHKTLLAHVWGPEAENQSEYLRVFIGQLRKKLDSPPNYRYILTEPWVGYMFNPTGATQ